MSAAVMVVVLPDAPRAGSGAGFGGGEPEQAIAELAMIAQVVSLRQVGVVMRVTV